MGLRARTAPQWRDAHTTEHDVPTTEPSFLLYDLVSNPPKYDWFGLRDLTQRMCLALALFYYLLFTRPLQFFRYSWYFNTVWYYTVPGAIMTLALPVLPLILLGYVLFEEIRSKFQSNWMTGCPGAGFYARPKGYLHNLCWQWWLNVGMYTSIFLLVRDSKAGALSSYDDSQGTTKQFWFDKGAQCGARYPLKVCEWQGDNLAMMSDWQQTPRMILKIVDSYLGIGDQIVELGQGEDTDEVMFLSDQHALEELLRTKYAGKHVLGTEFVIADPQFGVHQGDTLTLRLPDGQVHVLRTMFWGDCSGQTSHSSSSAYLVDYKSETITEPAHWYSPAFKNSPSNRAGQKLPGIKQAALKCAQMHSQMPEHPWLNAIGWDTMSTGDGKPHVFFEGNFAGSRFRRHCFSSPRILYEMVKLCAPFSLFGVTIVGT